MWLKKFYLRSIKFFCDVDVAESEEPENDNTLECFDEDFFDFDIEDSLYAGLPDDDFYIVEDMGLVKRSWTLFLSKGLSTLLTPKE